MERHHAANSTWNDSWLGNFLKGDSVMPRGDKSSYTDKQKRKAEHIEKSYKDKGLSDKVAEKRAWATVNKDSGGGNKSGSGKKSDGKSGGSEKSSKSKSKSSKSS
ncbi:MAG: hypothetical protein ACREPU_06110 [Rhodanobacteraceae bacterium]